MPLEDSDIQALATALQDWLSFSSFMQSFAKWFRFYFRIIDEAYKDSKRVVVFIISGLLGLQNITGDLAVVVLLVSVLKVS